jgi:transcriptional regulator with XRE-family HTH domain
MTLGQKIRESRKEKGWTLETLAARCDRKKSWLSSVENDAFKGGPDPEALIMIADALEDSSILTYALMHNPICQRIIPRAFTPLNNINNNASAILAKTKEELAEGIEAVEIMSRMFSVKDPLAAPAYRETLFAKLEQLKDVSRVIEELFANLETSGVLSAEDQLEIHVRQQLKVEAHGHHRRKED